MTLSIDRVTREITPHLETRVKATARNKKTQGSVGLAAFFKIAEKWALSVAQQTALLGISSQSTFHKYKKDPESANVDKDMMERISYILGIFKDLQTLLKDPVSADRWIKAPNSAAPFNGKTALDLMCRGRVVDLYIVRQYLAAQKGV